jgi:hypothetical protein
VFSTMRLLRILTIVLLVLRVLAAPITTRPANYRPGAKAGFIVRICAWPAQRPHRATESLIAASRDFGPGHRAPKRGFRGTMRLARTSPILGRVFHQVNWSGGELSARRRLDSPRC